jgi:signal peptidase I
MAPNDRVQISGQPHSVAAPPNGQPASARVPAPVPVSASPRPKKKEEAPAVKDAFREVVETVVFVIVLVLLLKTFVAEAFVIPTGSMAETLLGYQKWETCPQCGYEFPVNCSSEVDPQQGPPVPVVACTCPNCRYKDVWLERDGNGWRTLKEPPAWGSGDRVLVSKFPFDNGHFGQFGMPRRGDVVVFKYPEAPQKGQIPMNYIKRLCGLPGETIAILDGDLYVCKDVAYPPESHALPQDPKDLWKSEYTYSNDAAAVAAFHAGRFEIFRKTPDLLMAMRRLVYDNDHQPKDLIGKVKPRWHGGDHWAANDTNVPTVFRQNGDSGDDVQWLRYQHILINRDNTRPLEVPADPTPQLIRNFMGYNTGELARPGYESRLVETNWVGDLMVECTANVEALQGELTLELSKGPDRFQARFDLKDGSVSLWRLADGRAEQLAKADKVITKTGTFHLRLANVDCRLTVWVDGKLPFADGVDYAPWIPKAGDPTDPAAHPNNKEPASIGAARGAKVSVSHLQLWRDTYYTPFTDSRVFGPTELRTMYVQPGHFLCLGDNSSESSDSRYWGLVPERLLLGRALVVYYPLFHNRAGLIR